MIVHCSCAPNAAPDPIDPMSVISVAPIKIGDEVCLSYFGVQALELGPRTNFLRNRLGFHCGCELCRERMELNSAEVQARLDILTSTFE